MDRDTTIEDVRGQLRNTTDKIVELLAERLDLSRKIGVEKQRRNLPVEDYAAEAELRSRVLDRCKQLGVPEDLALRVLNILVENSVEVQKKQRYVSPVSHTKMFAMAKEAEREGKEVIHLEIGEPDVPPPQPVIEEAIESIRKGYVHYGSAQGIRELREAISAHYRDSLGVDISPDQIIVTAGARLAVYLAVASTLRPGGGLVTFEPIWPAYKECAEAVGGRSVAVKTRLEEGWAPNQGLFENTLKAGAEMIALNHPCNPTGKSLDRKEYQFLIDEAGRRRVPILSDETYSLFAFKPSPSILELADSNYVLVSSFSKTFRMTGFRIAYAISSKEVISRMTRLQSLILTSVPEFVQRSAVKAFECKDDAKKYATLIKGRMRVVKERLKRLPVSFYEPDGGFYVFPRVEVDRFNADEFATRLLKEKGVAVSPGSGFGDYPDFFRISVCQRTALIFEGLKRIGEMLS